MKKYTENELERLGKQIAERTQQGDMIKTDKHGHITNWNGLSEATKNWLKNG